MEDGASVSSASGSGGGQGSSSASSSAGEEVLLRIHVPELKVEKCMQFHKEDIVWEVKQQALANLPKELRESFNYGLFYPPQNGRAGKFLDEERPLSDYPFSSPVGYLELKYKRRVYKMFHLEEKSLRALHTRANLRRFIESIKDNNADKVAKMCSKGLDPNFHCNESGETPLTITTTRLKKCGKMVMTLVNGGALLDYRTREGLTPMHRAVQADNYEAVRTLLDLGASPNYRDIRGLTPLYYTVTHNTDPTLCDILLHDYSVIGASDNQGWQETHQACRNKLVQHLEHLLFYGADMNAQNASGNTPLHVCAVNNLEDCARVLLFRGCDKSALNYANQTPYQVAVIAGNMELGQVIQNHSSVNVVPHKEPPKFNPKRRISGISLSRTHSDPRLEACLVTKPPSPSPSSRSIPPFSSASSLSETSTGSGSTCTHPSEADSEGGSGIGGNGIGSVNINNANENSDIVSDSSGVCTSNSCSNDSYDSTIVVNSNSSTLTLPDVSDFNVGMLVVCLKQYAPRVSGHLHINPGEIIEVTGSTDDGLLEGCFKGRTGLFPPQCVQEIRLRNPKAVRENLIGRIQNRNGSGHSQSHGSHYGTTPRMRKVASEPRTVVLQRGKKGFGFILRGAKATSPLIERPYDRGPALQYLDDVDPGGVADEAGLKKGDYLLKINGEDVSQASHEHVVNLIKKAGDSVRMTIQSPPALFFQTPGGGDHSDSPHYQTPAYALSGASVRGCQTLPRKLSNVIYATTGRGTLPPPAPPPRDPRTTLSVGRARARSMVSGLQDFEALDCMQRGSQDALMTQSAYYNSSRYASDDSSTASSPNAGGGSPLTNGMAKVASINPRAAGRRMSETALLEQEDSARRFSPTGKPPKVYASVAEMKKAKALKARLVADSTRIHKDYHSTPDLPALQGQVTPVALSHLSSEEKRLSLSQEHLLLSSVQNALAGAGHGTLNSFEKRTGMYHQYESQDYHPDHQRIRRSVSAVNANQLMKAGVHPPPSHPPPPVPVGQMVKVDLSRTKGDYAAISQQQSVEPIEKQTRFLLPSGDENNSETSSVMSSFRPADSAKLYASPFGIKNSKNNGCENDNSNSKAESTKSRSQSLPPVNREREQKVSDKETSGDSGVYSSGYTTFRRKSKDLDSENQDINRPHRDKQPYGVPKSSRSLSDSSSSNHLQSKTVNGKPSIPDPDYSSEEEPYSLQEEIKKRTQKKKKHTVMFAPNLVSSSSDLPSAQTAETGGAPVIGSGNFADLIAQKAAERKARQENGGSSAPASATSSPIKKKIVASKEPMCLTDAIKGSNLFNKQRQKVLENNTSVEPKVISPSNGTSKVFNNTVNSKQNNNREDLKSQLKNSRTCPSDISLEDGDNSSSGVSSDQEHMHQENSSYVTVINTETDNIRDPKTVRITSKNIRDDSSEASESSDEASDRTWILTNDRGDRSDSGKDSDSSTGSRRSGTLTKNAVSLVKLPPPQESNERDIDHDMNVHATRMMAKSLDQDSISTVSSLSSLSSVSGSSCERNVNHQRHQLSLNNGYYAQPHNTSYTTSNIQQHSQLPPTSHGIRSAVRGSYNTNRQMCSRECQMMRSAEAESINNTRERVQYASSKSATLDRNFFNSHKGNQSSRDTTQNKYERSIEESLQLIRMHMDSLNEVNNLAGIPSPRAPPSTDMVLAPPPEFCDRSLASGKESSKRGGRTVIHITAEDPENELPVRIIKKSLTAKSSVPDDEHRTFRNKFLCEWTTKDTTDWLESLFMPEYMESFCCKQIDGRKLMELNNEKLINLGIRKIGHRVKMEKSLKRYKPVERIDL